MGMMMVMMMQARDVGASTSTAAGGELLEEDGSHSARAGADRSARGTIVFG